MLNNSQIANINKMRSTLRDLERWEALYRHRPKHKIKDGPKAWYVLAVSVSSLGKRVSYPSRPREERNISERSFFLSFRLSAYCRPIKWIRNRLAK